MARRQYSDDERANTLAALDGNGGNASQTSKETGVPRVTILGWAAGRVPPGVSELRHQKRPELAQRLMDVAHKMIDAVPGKIEAAPLQQTMTSIGIAVDKARLLSDLPTEITDNRQRIDWDKVDDKDLADVERLATKLAATVGNTTGVGAP